MTMTQSSALTGSYGLGLDTSDCSFVYVVGGPMRWWNS